MVHQSPGTKAFVNEKMKDLREHVPCFTEKSGAHDPETREGPWARFLACFVVPGVEPAEHLSKSSFCRELGAEPQTAYAKGFQGFSYERTHQKKIRVLGSPLGLK